MKNLIEMQPMIREVLKKANEDHMAAHEMAETGIITESLSMYLKELVNMRSCLDIAKSFAEEGSIDDSSTRLSEALSVLTEISRVYSYPLQYEGRRELAEIAKAEFRQAYQECQNLLRGRN